MAECMDFLNTTVYVPSNMFEDMAGEIASDMLAERGLDTEEDGIFELYEEFKWDYLEEELFVALQDAFNSIKAKPYYDKWNEKLDEMIGARK